MFLIILLVCGLLLSETEGFQSRFTSLPSKPTISHSGGNVTFTWRYRLSQTDRLHFRWLVFGEWKNGDISKPLMTMLKDGRLVSHSQRVRWNGNKNAASFKLHNVSLLDDRLYGCKLDFEAFSVRDSVRLIVIAPPQIKKNNGHKLTQVKVTQGQSIVIPCDVTGYPLPWIFWTQDGKTVQNSTKNSALTIRSAEEHMTGIYTCVAQNEYGVDTYDVLLVVLSCKHHASGVGYNTQGNAVETHVLAPHPHTTLAPTFAVAFVLILIFGAYFFFQYVGARSQKFKKYRKMPEEEQARSLMGEWSSFSDNGDKI